MANDRFNAIVEELKALHAAKGADYGDRTDLYSNFRRAQRLGISPFMGCLVRLSDKWERVIQLTQHPAHVKSESIVDTLRDLSIYAIIASILYEEERPCGQN